MQPANTWSAAAVVPAVFKFSPNPVQRVKSETWYYTYHKDKRSTAPKSCIDLGDRQENPDNQTAFNGGQKPFPDGVIRQTGRAKRRLIFDIITIPSFLAEQVGTTKMF